jgi:hypothetical protein
MTTGGFMAEPQQKPKIVDIDRLILFGPHPDNPSIRSKMVWASRNGHPRVTVYTNHPQEQGLKGILNAPMDALTFKIFARKFREVCLTEGEQKGNKVDCLGSAFDDQGKRIPNEKRLVGELWFGKDANGIVWLSLVAPDRPRVKFELRLSEWHKIYFNGQPLTEAEASKQQGLSYVETLVECFSDITKRHMIPETAYETFGRYRDDGEEALPQGTLPRQPGPVSQEFGESFSFH